MKTVAYYRMSAYSTAKKNDMSIDQFFKVRELVSGNKKLKEMMKRLKERS